MLSPYCCINNNKSISFGVRVRVNFGREFIQLKPSSLNVHVIQLNVTCTQLS